MYRNTKRDSGECLCSALLYFCFLYAVTAATVISFALSVVMKYLKIYVRLLSYKHYTWLADTDGILLTKPEQSVDWISIKNGKHGTESGPEPDSTERIKTQTSC